MDDEVLSKLVALYQESGVLVALYDGFDRLRYANGAFRSAFFVEPDETPFWADLMRRNRENGRGTVIRSADFDAWLLSTQSRRGKTGYRAFETDLADGRWLWMTETVTPDGWMLCIASDITSLRANNRAVRQDRDMAIKASQTDELTGVANRRFIHSRIEEMIESAAAGRAATGCLSILDIDNFKYINDRFGHAAGDAVLRDFARSIHGIVRRLDCFGRIGGEEFVVLTPATPLSNAELIVGRMLSQIRLSRPLRQFPDFTYSFSAGIASVRSDDTVDTLHERADKALYAAKMAGRNRIFLEQDQRDHPAQAG